ncbi:MAG: glycosyltransferase [Patescibacteria group bacterium]
MKVAVIIPSYQEADNIAFVVAGIDRGLDKLRRIFPRLEAAIINVDNSSPDKTSRVFLAEPTRFKKLSFQTKGCPGKGKNLIFFLKKSLKQYDYFITLDADLKSLKPDWINKLLTPFLNDNQCDFVWPLYKRSRFEGSTTNHFARPFIKALFGYDIRQPIAGDFAFSRRLAGQIMSQRLPKTAYRYGIDILFSIRAMQSARHAYQIDLGNKIHKPSFSKLETMFPQIVLAAVQAISSGPRSGHSPQIFNTIASGGISADKIFRHHEQAKMILIRHLKILSKQIDRSVWLDDSIKIKVKSALANKSLDSGLWSLILASWLARFVKESPVSSKAADELLSFFAFRAVSFWNEARQCTAVETERVINCQTRQIDKLVNKKYVLLSSHRSSSRA